MGKPIVLVVFCIVAVSVIPAAASQKHSYVPPKGFVPDEKTAIRIAEAVWSPIYGEAMIQGEKPFVASLKSGVWTVRGSLPKGWVGGVAIAEISKSDGRILRVGPKSGLQCGGSAGIDLINKSCPPKDVRKHKMEGGHRRGSKSSYHEAGFAKIFR
jgi:hypothetical protein